MPGGARFQNDPPWVNWTPGLHIGDNYGIRAPNIR